MAVFECKTCGALEPHPRRYMYNFGKYVRCPLCGTYRLSRLTSPDRIDKFYRTPLNRLKGLFGGALYHCRFCRVQFYDRRARREEPARNNGGAGVVRAS
jgi:transcription elongation factor Elf1